LSSTGSKQLAWEETKKRRTAVDPRLDIATSTVTLGGGQRLRAPLEERDSPELGVSEGEELFRGAQLGWTDRI
jgi:hypothetical protein